MKKTGPKSKRTRSATAEKVISRPRRSVAAHAQRANAGQDNRWETNELLETITRNMGIIIAVQDRDFRYTYFNKAYQDEIKKLTGKDLCLGMSMLDLFDHLPDQQRTAKEEWSCPLRGEITNRTIEFGEPGLYRRTYNVLHTPIRDKSGAVVAAGEIAHDITERKRNEEDIQRERDLLQHVMNGAKNSHLVYLDRDFNFVRVNEAYAATCGYRPEEMIGRNHFALYPHAENEAIFARVRDTGVPVEYYDKPFEFPDQPERGVTYWDWTLTPVKDRAGMVEGLVFSLHETTVRKRAEAAVEQSMKRFKLLSETADELLHSMEPQTAVQTACRKVLDHIDCQIFFNFLSDKKGKLRLNAFAGISAEKAKHIEWLEYGVAVCGSVARDGRRIVAEHIQTISDERTAFVKSLGVQAYACHPLQEHGGKVIGTLSFGTKNRETFSDDDLFVMKAITDQVSVALNRMNNESALRAAHSELERRANELEAVNRELEMFSYTVSHDLKAPLRSIEGFSRAMLEEHAAMLDETGSDYLKRVNAAAHRMGQFIDAILNMARLTRSELHEQTVDLSGLAQIITDDLRNQAPERRVEFVIADNVKAKGDRFMLQAVLENLLHNAWKFTGKRETARIEFGSTMMEGKTVYFVRDDGVGFDMRFVDKLFQPFKRLHADSEFPGLGIGLATVNRIIRRHNGRLWAESKPGEGATFYFTL